jgi:hypothetical protein
VAFDSFKSCSIPHSSRLARLTRPCPSTMPLLRATAAKLPPASTSISPWVHCLDCASARTFRHQRRAISDIKWLLNAGGTAEVLSTSSSDRTRTSHFSIAEVNAYCVGEQFLPGRGSRDRLANQRLILCMKSILLLTRMATNNVAQKKPIAEDRDRDLPIVRGI